jgi:hypothetical protein
MLVLADFGGGPLHTPFENLLGQLAQILDGGAHRMPLLSVLTISCNLDAAAGKEVTTVTELHFVASI